MSIKINISQFSWMRYSTIRNVEVLSGVDILNPQTVSWFGIFSPPNLANRNGDIEYTIQTGDRLDKLSLFYYGTPFLWWVIAARNEIDLPDIELNSGLRIIVPDPQYVTTQLVGNRVVTEQ
jgi:hypothetical protein